MREATLLDASSSSTSELARWARIPAVPTWTAAKLAFIADTASTGIAWAVRRASGSYRAGSSLDNSLRFGPRSNHEWALVVSRADMVHNSFGQGSVHIWAADGTLLAAGSQTFALRTSDASSGAAAAVDPGDRC
jgi:acyl-CoA thioesterase